MTVYSPWRERGTCATGARRPTETNEKWIRIIGKPEYRDGICVRLLGSIQDIHDRKKAELEKLEALKDRAFILDNIDEGFVMLDQNWDVSYWNKKAEEITGLKAADLIGKSFKGRFDQLEEGKIFGRYEDAVKHNKSIHFEEHYKDVQKWFEVSAYPYAKGISIFFREITDRKQYEDMLKISNERFENVADATNDAIWDWDIIKNM